MQRVETPPSLPEGTEIGGYVLDERIGVGGFGEVYRAHHPVIGRSAAIKVLHARYSHDPDAVARFVDEARAVNRIKHPGIVEVFDFGRAHDREYFVMELIDGRSLRSMLAGPMPVATALPLLRGIAEAVDAAHVAGVAHRDLKPDNVFVLANGKTKLIDFGLAKLSRESETVTETGSIFGTPLYMSPEQCRGRGIDARTDIYSFGALAYHVLVGQPPFGGDPIELALHHLNDAPPPPNVSKVVDRVLIALLAKDPSERPQTLVAAIAAMEGSATLRVKRTRRVKRAVLVALPLAAIGAGVAYVAQREPAATSTCESGASRVAFWQPDAIAKRFPTNSSIWKIARPALDAQTRAWTTQWDAACRADRSDPLLYGQRLACLENALVELRTSSTILSTVDAEKLEDAWGEDMLRSSVEDCENVAVLRAQVPPPEPRFREQVAAVRAHVEKLAIDGWIAWLARDLAAIKRIAAELNIVGQAIEVTDPPSASSAILSRVFLLREAAQDMDVQLLPVAWAALDDAIARITANRDDLSLAWASVAVAWRELNSIDRPEALTRAHDALDRAEQTLRRAGNPSRQRDEFRLAQSTYFIYAGRFEEAIAQLREALTRAQHVGFGRDAVRTRLVVALGLAGRIDEAHAEAKHFVDDALARFGDERNTASGAYQYRAMTSQLTSDLTAALDDQRKATERSARSRALPAGRRAWGTMYVADLELRVGKFDPAHIDATIKTIAGLGSTPDLQNPDGVATARRAGLWELFVYGAKREGLTGETEHFDHLATLAFYRGEDFAPLAANVKCPCNWIAFSRWLAVLADKRDVDKRLAALEAEYSQDPAAITYSGIVLAKLDRWSDAKAKLEFARNARRWERQADLVELDTWLGLARLRAAETDAARASFEEALRVISIESNGSDGFSYMTPVASHELAMLIEKDDPARAKWLRERARLGFERLSSR